MTVGMRGSPILCSDVELQKYVRGWWCELWGNDGVACRYPHMMNGVYGYSIVGRLVIRQRVSV